MNVVSLMGFVLKFLYMTILEEHEITYCLSVKPNKAPGPDGLNEQVLKDCVY